MPYKDPEKRKAYEMARSIARRQGYPGGEHRKVNCVDCGKSVERLSANQKRCQPCSRVHAEEVHKAYKIENREKMLAKKREYNRRPDVKKRHNEEVKAYQKTEAFKAWQRAYRKTAKQWERVKKYQEQFKTSGQRGKYLHGRSAVENLFSLIALNTAVEQLQEANG